MIYEFVYYFFLAKAEHYNVFPAISFNKVLIDCFDKEPF